MEDEVEESGQGSEVEDASLVEGSPVQGDVSQNTEEKINPAWDSMLEALPSSLHSIVTPHLKQWDRNYQDGINKVHSQYESYKPYADNGIGKDKIDYALQIMEAVETRPADMIKALQAYTGMSKEEATEVVKEQGQVETEVPEELLNHPKLQEMEKMIQTMAQHFVSEKQREADAQQDAELAAELTSLKEKHGAYDEEYVLTYAMAHPKLTLDQCVEAYKAKETEILTASRRVPAPKVLGQGGGTVDNQITKADMKDPKSRKSVVAQLLQQAQSN